MAISYAAKTIFSLNDHVGFGGTLANLRGFIELHGGRVTGATALTETRDAKRIALGQQTLNMLWEKHGSELDLFWQANLGYGLDCLTEVEAGYLCRVESVARIKDRVAEATELARSRGLWPVEFAAG